ncbi:MAG: hypothetical protein V1487_02695 [bacterium]
MNDDYVLTEVDKYNHATWMVLDEIQRELLRSHSQNRIITYRQSRNIREMALKLYGYEEAVIVSLVQNKVIEEVDKYIVEEGGVEGTTNYEVYHLRSFRVTEKFEKSYNKYADLVAKLNTSTSTPLLIFSMGGNIIFNAIGGKVYKTIFGSETNNYKLLHFLAQSPHVLFSFEELDAKLNDPKGHGDRNSERRVRDTVGGIVKKLGCKQNELFVTNFGFELVTNAQINS